MEDYQNIPLHWINRLSFLSRRTLAARFRAAGHVVSPEEWAVLLILWSQGAQSPGALADATIRDRTTLTRLLDGMVGKGFVVRREDPADRRRQLVEVTASGQALRHDLVPIARALIAEAAGDISPADLQTTVTTLRQMTANLMQTTNQGDP